MVPYVPFWSRMVPNGPVWSRCYHLVPYGSSKVQYGTVWSCMASIVSFGPVQSCMVPNGPVWSRNPLSPGVLDPGNYPGDPQLFFWLFGGFFMPPSDNVEPQIELGGHYLPCREKIFEKISITH